MTRDPSLPLAEIVESAERIALYVRDLSRDEFVHGGALRDAIERRLEIIGEAANQLPLDFRTEHPNVPWSELVGLRNVVVHRYFELDAQLVWEAATEDLPRLVPQVRKIFEALSRKLARSKHRNGLPPPPQAE